MRGTLNVLSFSLTVYFLVSGIFPRNHHALQQASALLGRAGLVPPGQPHLSCARRRRGRRHDGHDGRRRRQARRRIQHRGAPGSGHRGQDVVGTQAPWAWVSPRVRLGRRHPPSPHPLYSHLHVIVQIVFIVRRIMYRMFIEK